LLCKEEQNHVPVTHKKEKASHVKQQQRMKKNYLVFIIACLFFLTLTYFSMWWIVLSILVALVYVAYRFYSNKINRVNACKTALEMELTEKCEQLEKAVRREKTMRSNIEEIQKSKTTVLNKISHEIRSPMNGMMGMASLLEQTLLDAEQQDYLGTIRSCGKNMITAINDILLKDVLNYSKGENGKSMLEQKIFNLKNCVEDALKFFSVKAGKAGITLTCTIAHDVPEQISTDEDRLRQVLLNLIENAVKNTITGEILIAVNIYQTKNAGELNLSFEVRDTGSGITNEMLDKIRIRIADESSVNVLQTGEGLGLITSSRLTKIMGGEFIIKSKLKEGTRVFFNIIIPVNPVLAAKKRHILKEKNSAPLITGKFSEIYPMHILIAEDNPINELFAVKMLNHLGYKPEVAKNGQEVLEIVSQQNFDLILMDVEMPEMDGLEATRMIRLCIKSQPVIIAMTANAMQGDREICMQAGMDDYLSKPVDPEDLKQILEKWALTAKESL
jgi:signal transduction histidine kinase/ActR/RegA family two-component response regulator